MQQEKLELRSVNQENEVLENTITIEWSEETIEDNSRIGAMYCFKNCDVNNN